jgi:phosphohistidine phosphatase
MPTLRVLRHAKSSWDHEGLADHERPLNARGEREATRMGKHLRELAEPPELVLCSSALRTRQTLERLHLDDVPVEFEDELYGAPASALLERLRELHGEESVLLIGHNPGVHGLVMVVAGEGEHLQDVAVGFPTCALATLAFEGTWAGLGQGTATLTGYVTGKQLGS